MSRVYCAHCLLPHKACLCAHVITQACPMPVLILQHPQEAKHAKSTVPLLRLALPDISINIGEALVAPPPLTKGRWWLLYPGAQALDLDDEQSTPLLDDIGGLIVLDGTWRKTRLLLHLNPWLTHLPTLTFSNAPAGQYTIRKGPGGQALSTLESVNHVLHTLHPSFNSVHLLTLLQARVRQFQDHGAQIQRKNCD